MGHWGGRVAALLDRDPPLFCSFRPARSLLRSPRARLRAEDSGGARPRTRPGHTPSAFAHFPTAGNSQGTGRGVGGGGGVLCPYCLLGLLPRTAFPTLSSRKSCGFPRRRKEVVEKVADFFFSPFGFFLVQKKKKKKPTTNKKPLNSQRVWPRGDTSGWRGGSELCIPSPSRLPPGPAAPLPRAGSAPRPAAAAPAAAGLSSGMWRRGMCMQMRRARGGTGAGPGRSVC